MTGATVRSAVEIHTSYVLLESGTDFRYPFWPMRLVMTIGFALVALALICTIISSIRELREEGKKA
jgi:TRAP-type mannitol/chloroaromatic compound transport system permease small subunit